MTQTEFLNLLSARRGHFRFESGYHSDEWLDLDKLLLRSREVRRFAVELAHLLSKYNVAAICGPLVGGALIAQTIAAELDVEFYYTERFVLPDRAGLYPVEYRLPKSLRKNIEGKAVAIVDDVISAGSAVRGTYEALRAAGASSVAIGALLVMGSAAPDYFAAKQLPVEAVAHQPINLWLPADCPLCAAQAPLEDVTAPSTP